MKTILEFEDTPEDKLALNRCLKSLDMACVLFELSYNLKKRLECEEEIDYNTLDIVFKRIYELIEENNINIDDIIV